MPRSASSARVSVRRWSPAVAMAIIPAAATSESVRVDFPVFVQCTASSTCTSNTATSNRQELSRRAILQPMCAQRPQLLLLNIRYVSPTSAGQRACVCMCRERQADKAGEKQHSRSSISRADGEKEALRTIRARRRCTVVHCDAHLGGQTFLHAPWST